VQLFLFDALEVEAVGPDCARGTLSLGITVVRTNPQGSLILSAAQVITMAASAFRNFGMVSYKMPQYRY
jgi:hypothetical protein